MADPDHNQAPHTTQAPQTTVNKTSGTGSGIIIGVLVVLVLGFGFFFFSGGTPATDSGDINVNVEGATDGAADAVEGAAEEATGN
ncbi:MAG: hypothetical protein KBT62_05880 [Sulfitobacter litoralis]|jgi:uncharacterized protein HemX|uniref:Uncharacterized protein n=2 Tax=root TaxID=1 RepID=A0A1H0SPC9_9RHOB|nr:MULTISPECIES: hypothetical protein [Sulfitobacter]MBQ0716664.1 hypothetical protein [Sulfitobacter litoralis]MBQ0765856.1 hypothetical protein [Sulfitobacter litoralis]MBQ0800693.1 hypothetical protein [Sulfitobacter litoralis]MCF7726311.1 hypothetical protein [Sulfitobacter sp. M22]MCF7777668.1 hypothetical protein [Sulfitobacter sp. M220]|tara:strand:- start:43 stop:297 length:255 start_codon:yes stop_codon:yes gene_type:complete